VRICGHLRGRERFSREKAQKAQKGVRAGRPEQSKEPMISVGVYVFIVWLLVRCLPAWNYARGTVELLNPDAESGPRGLGCGTSNLEWELRGEQEETEGAEVFSYLDFRFS